MRNSNMKEMVYEIIGGSTKIDHVENYMSLVHQFSKQHSIHIQLLNAKMIFGKIHLETAIFHAIRAMNGKKMSTQSIEMEILLYSAGECQLSHAIPKMGIKQGETSIAAIFINEHNQKKIFYDSIELFIEKFNIQIDDAVLKQSIGKIRQWSFSVEEIQTISKDSLEDLILEKVAMVDIIK
ncbi:MAG: hypothetical protein DRN27_02245 [Thermoplasmata archaeon]|nr:MAG: hypothetical protein DRN27_02245 [Thermoplasmata archaeon]